MSARYLLDTCAVIDTITDRESLGRDILDEIDYADVQLCVSLESVREIIQKYKLGKLGSKIWRCAGDILTSLERDYQFHVVNIDRNVISRYADLQINVAQDHRDPSDHIIIAHAMTLDVPLISRDQKFAF